MRQSIPVEFPVRDQRLLVACAYAVEDRTWRAHRDANGPVRDVAWDVDGDDGALLALKRQDRLCRETRLLIHDTDLPAILAAANQYLARTENRNGDAGIPIFL